jgi:RsiW-degrading membrane proteinase PrsW (M82 family)
MSVDILLHVAVGTVPVLCFLAALLYLDSYKLVSLRAIVTVVACGVGVAGACYFANAALLGVMGIEFIVYTRFAGPFVEELGKALVVVVLIRAHRIGFLVDAAIFGFAIGTGFAIVENVLYQRLIPDAGLGTWIVRGFGTALMHGGATAIFAMMGLAMLERKRHGGVTAFLPGFALAVALHSAFNHMYLSPRLSTLAVLVVLPPLLFLVFERSERAVADWLGRGFDADAQMLESINSGRFTDTPAGRYLESLKRRLKGPVIADLLCYLRLHTELALRAKGILMMRENGFDTTIDDETRAKFAELRYLEQSMGRTGMRAIRPLLHMSHRDLWQLYMLGSN